MSVKESGGWALPRSVNHQVGAMTPTPLFPETTPVYFRVSVAVHGSRV
jgi:hypothetical protein